MYEIEFYTNNNHTPLFDFLNSIPKKTLLKYIKSLKC